MAFANLRTEWDALTVAVGDVAYYHRELDAAGNVLVAETKELSGLALRVRRNDDGTLHRTWTFEYRMPGETAKRKARYGVVGSTPPALSFDDARRMCLEDKLGLQRTKNVAEGGQIVRVPDAIDPRTRRSVRVVSAGDSVAELVAEYVVQLDRDALSAKSLKDRSRRLLKWLACKPVDGSPVPSALRSIMINGSRPLRTLTVRDMYRVLNVAKDALGPSAMRKLWIDVRLFLQWTATAGHIELDAMPLPPAAKWGSDTKRTRVLSRVDSDGNCIDQGEELRRVLGAIAAEPYPYRHIFLLLLLTGRRAGKVMRAQWAQLQGDQWILPPEPRSKYKRGHTLPLPALAVDVLADARKHSKHPDYVFAVRASNPVSEIEPAHVRIMQASGVADWSPHDLRRTAATHISRLSRCSREVLKAVLGHADESVTGIYDRDPKLPAVKAALDLWAAELVKLGAKIDTLAAPQSGARPAPVAVLPAVDAAGC